jgi:hypothetical protein
MHIRIRLLMAALTAALALSLAATTASALRSLSVVGSTTVSANGLVKFIQRGGGTTVECKVTIVRTISRIIPKIAGTLLGAIIAIITDRAGNPNCRSSLGTLRNIIILELENPGKYRLKFQSIVGTLPIITAIKKTIEGLRIGFEITEPFGATLRCLYEERVRAEGRPGEATEDLNERQQLARIRFGANIALRTGESGALCPREGELFGEPVVVEPKPTFRLI